MIIDAPALMDHHQITFFQDLECFCQNWGLLCVTSGTLLFALNTFPNGNDAPAYIRVNAARFGGLVPYRKGPSSSDSYA